MGWVGTSRYPMGWVKDGNYTYLGIDYSQNRLSVTEIGLAYWVGSKKVTQPIGMGRNLSPTQWYGSKS
jgi:hypothetical protein